MKPIMTRASARIILMHAKNARNKRCDTLIYKIDVRIGCYGLFSQSLLNNKQGSCKLC